MLEALRRGSTGWVAKVLFALLVFSFAIWGVADVFTGWGRGAIAKVGSQEIRAEDFQRTFQNEINMISQQAGQRISPEQARAAGLDERVVSRLIAWSAVEQHADKLNLALSDEALAEGLQSDEAFAGPDGKFNRFAFENVINRLGVSERGFLHLRRRDEVREQLTSALVNGIAVPPAMIELMNTWRNETRTVDYFAINADKMVKVPEPDEAQLKATYEANLSSFMAPEYRKLSVLVLSVDELKKAIEISDADAQERYEHTKTDYDTPERRRVQQIAFKDRAAAEEAKKAIDGGKSFGDVAKESGAQDSDIDLGLISKDRLIDKKIADAAFALEKDKVSDPVEGRFATVLLRVSDVQPAVTRNFADVKDDVKQKLARERAESELQTHLDQVEDQRSGGKTLKEIADELKLQFYDVPETDRNNRDSAGKTAIPVTDASALLTTAFGSGLGIENEMVELSNGTYAWVDVADTTPQKQKPLDDVKDQVKALFMTQERARLVADFADKLVERANNGEAMSRLATEAGAQRVSETPPFNRTTEPQGMSKAAVARAFTLPKGQAGSAPDTNDKTRIVFKVTTVNPAPALSETERVAIGTDLRNEIADETLGEYVMALQRQLGTHIFQDELRRVTGAATGEDVQ
ncbi:Peptidyl-prolyl cis-trans isomerase PpiD [Hyphomicrobium sulfonivorans]|uniref:Parvulin-like PPIase n=1 Tax=Hyphomicrobium sulfonivorans TaxID=121290 RepID=A0A120CW84_HYPSL|nr:SurA N-terminal domain-containing protein [Hyphomicrobium sulfonivorans]KWT68999.1 Peptidyl-prolyl cis-trans isomerase PpiD [Hyphomicrobium sulfonivorans]